MEDIFTGLNERQREAAESLDGRIRVIAGAGSGKTKTLTCRYAYLVDGVGIDPANILCLTFTNKAAQEMRRRISKMLNRGGTNDFVCTIHGFCVKFLRREIYRLGYPQTFAVLDDDDAKQTAKQVLEELGLDRKKNTVRNFLAKVEATKEAEGLCQGPDARSTYIQKYLLPESKPIGEDESDSFLCYLRKQVKSFALDFQDLIFMTLYLLDTFPDVLQYWQEQINYLMVDETQDCNPTEWMIFERLSALNDNLFVVGDPDQAIYEWRGSKPRLFIDFEAGKDIVLDENYRSTPQILDVANCVISNNQMRLQKNLFSHRVEGPKVIHFHAKSEQEEAKWVVQQIQTLQTAGAAFSDIALLYRASYLSRNFEQELVKQAIPYTIWGGTRFFERKEVKDALSYLRLICSHDDLAFMRICNVPSRKIGKQTLKRIQIEAEAQGCTLFEAMKNIASQLANPNIKDFISLIEKGQKQAHLMSVSDLLQRILQDSGYMESLRTDEIEERLENLNELSQSIKYFEEEHVEDTVTLENYLQEVALYTNADYQKDGNRVKLMTIHQSKGLEFPFVFVVGLSEGIFPSLRSIRDRHKNGEEEERRLMYVAVTRCEDSLYLTESEGYAEAESLAKYPSRFLKEIEEKFVVRQGKFDESLWEGTARTADIIDKEGAEPADTGLEVGDLVEHKIFGRGTITGKKKDGTSLEVTFAKGKRFLRPEFLQKSCETDNAQPLRIGDVVSMSKAGYGLILGETEQSWRIRFFHSGEQTVDKNVALNFVIHPQKDTCYRSERDEGSFFHVRDFTVLPNGIEFVGKRRGLELPQTLTLTDMLLERFVPCGREEMERS